MLEEGGEKEGPSRDQAGVCLACNSPQIVLLRKVCVGGHAGCSCKEGPMAEVACHQHYRRPKYHQAYEMGLLCWLWVETLSTLRQEDL